jgi:hypothetical protein
LELADRIVATAELVAEVGRSKDSRATLSRVPVFSIACVVDGMTEVVPFQDQAMFFPSSRGLVFSIQCVDFALTLLAFSKFFGAACCGDMFSCQSR